MESNYIVVSHEPKQNNDPLMLAWEDLYAAAFDFNCAFHLYLSDHQPIFVEKILRIIPKRRMVVYGKWQDKPVIAKFFFDPWEAKNHLAKEVAGINLLKQNKIPTPELYYQGLGKDKRIHVLLFQFIADAQDLQTIWETYPFDEAYRVLQSTVVELATQHVFGLTQRDLHMKNFLVTDQTIYTIDGAQISAFPGRLPKHASFHNLALFLSQLGIKLATYQEQLLHHYAKARGWKLSQKDKDEFFFLLHEWHYKRWKHYLKKIFRNCTEYVAKKEWNRMSVSERCTETPEWKAFIENPEMAFTHPTAKMLKDGGSSTVIKVTLDQRELVIKRYNMKNVWHRLRRCWRPSRAATSWKYAHKLKLFDLLTAKPVAFIEERFFGLRGKSYYVTEYINASHAGEYFIQHSEQPEKIDLMVERIATLLKNLVKIEITHGDLKITNILIDEQEQPFLIDFDGAKEHVTLTGLRRSWKKEIERFLENFRYQRSLREKFEIILRGQA